MTQRDALMRRALHATSVLNVGGALMFAFPDSVGKLGGLPSGVPHLYSWFLGYMVLLFGATYAWMARQAVINRPLVVFSALGKSGFFAVASLCFLVGELPFLTLVTAAGDLVFAAIFVWWLLGSDNATR